VSAHIAQVEYDGADIVLSCARCRVERSRHEVLYADQCADLEAEECPGLPAAPPEGE
jgi:hypothetical protein